MPSPRTAPSARMDDRILNPAGRRHYRRKYSGTEPRIGVAVLIGLAAIASWVAYKGARPDPELFAAAPGLQYRAAKAIDRGPLPKAISPNGWVEGTAADFGPENLYEKINGREGYYKGFGFERLHYVSLNVKGRPEVAIDIELFDLGKNANALGAYAGERGEGVEAQERDGAVAHIARNALFLSKGPYYVRVIGSEESEVIPARDSGRRAPSGRAAVGVPALHRGFGGAA